MVNIHCRGRLQDKLHKCDVHPYMCGLRKANAWFLKAMLQHDPFKHRAPSKQECLILLESLNAKSKAPGSTIVFKQCFYLYTYKETYQQFKQSLKHPDINTSENLRVVSW